MVSPGEPDAHRDVADGRPVDVAEGRADVRELIALWVDGYRQVEPLPAEDEEEIDTFLMLRRLMLTAYAGLRHDTELAAQMRASGYNAETCAIAEPYLSRFG